MILAAPKGLMLSFWCFTYLLHHLFVSNHLLIHSISIFERWFLVFLSHGDYGGSLRSALTIFMSLSVHTTMPAMQFHP